MGLNRFTGHCLRYVMRIEGLIVVPRGLSNLYAQVRDARSLDWHELVLVALVVAFNDPTDNMFFFCPIPHMKTLIRCA